MKDFIDQNSIEINNDAKNKDHPNVYYSLDFDAEKLINDADLENRAEY